MTTIAPTAPNFAPDGQSRAEQSRAQCATENARTISCAEHVLTSHTRTNCDLAHSNAIGEKAYTPVADSRSLGGAPHIAPAFDLLHTIVGNGHRATRHAPMTRPGSNGKYYTVHEAITNEQIAAHLLGEATYAVPLIGTDELASAGMIEQDAGGLDLARRILQAAQARRVVMFAIVVKGSDGHDGCHPWALYDGRYDPAAIRAQLRQIAEDAGASTDEIHPNKTNIRLPFGLHRWTNTRGRLVLPTGETYDLDDSNQLSMAEAAVAALPLNSAPPVVEGNTVLPSKPSNIVLPSAQRTSTGLASLTDVKARFNAEHTLDSLLTTWGAVEVKNGYICPCGVPHTHTPTLYISQKGRLFSYSTRCKLYTTKGYDAFGLYVKLYHNDNVIDAAKTLNPIEPRFKKRQDPPLTEPEIRVQTSEQRADADRKREARRAAAAATIADVQACASQDEELTNADRAVLDALIAVADGRDWCRPSKERLADMSGKGLGTVKRSLMILEKHGYFVSSGVGGGHNQTAIRTFLRGSFLREMIHESRERVDLDLLIGASEAAPTGEPAEWEYWQACDSESAGYDLALEFTNFVDLPVESEPIEAENSSPDAILQAAEPPISPIGETDPDAGGASYSPKLDQTRKRRRGALPPKERDARAKSRRQARFKAMDAPTLRREYIILSRKADKTANPSQRYALKEQVAEMEHYLALKDAELDRAILKNVQDAPPVVPRPHMLAPEGRPLTLAMELTPTLYTADYVPKMADRFRALNAQRQAGAP